MKARKPAKGKGSYVGTKVSSTSMSAGKRGKATSKKK